MKALQSSALRYSGSSRTSQLITFSLSSMPYIFWRDQSVTELSSQRRISPTSSSVWPSPVQIVNFIPFVAA